jgi:hypothetical protein
VAAFNEQYALLKMTVFGILCPVVRQTFTYVSEVLTASIIRAMRTSETSVNVYRTTRRNIPEDIRRRENLESHQF